MNRRGLKCISVSCWKGARDKGVHVHSCKGLGEQKRGVKQEENGKIWEKMGKKRGIGGESSA